MVHKHQNFSRAPQKFLARAPQPPQWLAIYTPLSADGTRILFLFSAYWAWKPSSFFFFVGFVFSLTPFMFAPKFSSAPPELLCAPRLLYAPSILLYAPSILLCAPPRIFTIITLLQNHWLFMQCYFENHYVILKIILLETIRELLLHWLFMQCYFEIHYVILKIILL